MPTLVSPKLAAKFIPPVLKPPPLEEDEMDDDDIEDPTREVVFRMDQEIGPESRYTNGRRSWVGCGVPVSPKRDTVASSLYKRI